MTTYDPHLITKLLHGARGGDPSAVETLLPLVYGELQGLANGLFARAHKGHMLQPTALVHEAWLKLARHLDGVEDRHHFFILAAHTMRQVLADHARGAKCQKRGDGRRRVELDPSLGSVSAAGIDLVDLDDSLTRLTQLNERHARVVELRIFGGLTIAETAAALEVSHGTVETDWFTARAWLRRELSRG